MIDMDEQKSAPAARPKPATSHTVINGGGAEAGSREWLWYLAWGLVMGFVLGGLIGLWLWQGGG